MNFKNKIYNKIKSKKPTNYLGFSLIELIIVIAIMAVLLGLVSPAVMQYLKNNKKKACHQNREAILAVYERCVYDSSIEIGLNDGDMAKMIPESASGGSNLYPPILNEVASYAICPLGKKSYLKTGGFGVNVSEGTAWIKCDSCEDTISRDMVGWKVASTPKTSDDIVVPTPALTSTPTPTPTPTPTEEPDPTPVPPDTNAWPYADDPNWWDSENIASKHAGQYTAADLNNTTNNMYITLNAPSGIFYSRAGGGFVYVAENNDQKIWYYEASTPEYYSALHPSWLIQLTGNEIEYDLVKDKKKTSNEIPIRSVTNGDIIRFKDPNTGAVYTYVYWHPEESNLNINIDQIKQYNNKLGNLYRVSTEY